MKIFKSLIIIIILSVSYAFSPLNIQDNTLPSALQADINPTYCLSSGGFSENCTRQYAAGSEQTVEKKINKAKRLYKEKKYSEAKSILWKILETQNNNEQVLDLLADVILDSTKIKNNKINKTSKPIKKDRPNSVLSESEHKQINFNELISLLKQSNDTSALQLTDDVNTAKSNNINTPEKENSFYRIKSLQYNTTQKGIQLVLSITGKTKYIIEKIPEPPMFVLDLLNCKNELDKKKFKIPENEFIYRIRDSQYKIHPTLTTRIVLDMHSWNNLQHIYRDKNNIIIDFE